MTDPVITWPKVSAEFDTFVRKHSDQILFGTLVSVDPSSGGSSQPGYAVFEVGELRTRGELKLDRKLGVYERLQLLTDMVRQITLDPPDVFACEEIPKRAAHHYLLWAVGATFAGARTPACLQVPIHIWKRVGQALGMDKSNENDAELIGRALIYRARYLKQPNE